MIQEMQLATEAQNEILPAVSLGTILIIEDDPRMQKVLRRIFTEERYAAVVAGDGQTGLDLFRREQPLAVVLDLILPNISGRELCQTFKSLSARPRSSCSARSRKSRIRFCFLNWGPTTMSPSPLVQGNSRPGFRRPSADSVNRRRQRSIASLIAKSTLRK